MGILLLHFAAAAANVYLYVYMARARATALVYMRVRAVLLRPRNGNVATYRRGVVSGRGRRPVGGGGGRLAEGMTRAVSR